MDFNVFVSYSSHDLGHVEALRAQLANTPLRLFVAQDSVPAGSDLPQQIRSAIAQCDLFVLVWSKNAKDSAWVSQEVGIAHAGNKPILPLVIDRDCAPGGFVSNLKYVALHEDLDAGIEAAKQVAMQAYEAKRKALDTQRQQSSDRGLVTAGVIVLTLWAMSRK
jgi:TIR domain